MMNIMERQKFRTGIALVLAIASVSITAFLYATGRMTALQALYWLFLCWVILDYWYTRKGQELKRLGNMTIGAIYRAHRDGSVVPVSTPWLGRTLDAGTTVMLLAMVIVFFRT